jgi:hypothetical protein
VSRPALGPTQPSGYRRLFPSRSVCPSVHPSIYCFTALVNLGLFFSFLILYT